MFSIAAEDSCGVCRFSPGRARATDTSETIPGGGSRPGGLGSSDVSRRDVVHLFLAALLQGHDLDKQQEQEELLPVGHHLKQQDLASSYIVQRMRGAYVCRARGTGA